MRIAAILGLVLVGCGGASETDLFTPPAASTNDVDASVLDSGKNNPDGNLPGKDGGGPDALGAPDVNQPDTFVPPTSTIQCGNSMCDPANSVCCRTGTQPPGFKYACVANAGQCKGQGSVVLECSKAANCPNMGDVCCASLQNGGQFNVATSTQCVPGNQCQMNNGTVVVCDPADPNACPNGGTCQQSKGTLPGYDICL